MPKKRFALFSGQTIAMAKDQLRDSSSTAAVKVEALRHLNEHLPRSEALTFLLAAMNEQEDDEVGEAACQEIAARGLKNAAEHLAHLLPNAEPRVAVAIAATLGEIGDARIEPALFPRLKRGELEVRRAMIEALARVGTARSIELLRLVGQQDTRLRSASRAAIARVEARLANATRGGLSLVDTGAAGGLSLAGPMGALSETEPDEG